jgi:hypothetical protein
MKGRGTNETGKSPVTGQTASTRTLRKRRKMEPLEAWCATVYIYSVALRPTPSGIRARLSFPATSSSSSRPGRLSVNPSPEQGMGCASSSVAASPSCRSARAPGYEEPVVLASQTCCKHAFPSSCFFIASVFLCMQLNRNVADVVVWQLR